MTLPQPLHRPEAPVAIGGAPRVRTLGYADYISTWHEMRAFTACRTANTPDELWIVEHPPVFTLGQAAKREHLLTPGAIAVVHTDRGGQVTYHGPGQVVVYTLIDLRRLGIYVRELVYRIEQAVIQTLAAFGVEGRRVRGAPGIYVTYPGAAAVHAGGQFAGLAKIAALGIKVSGGCSYHGVALNVAMDLEPFARIDPCGYAGLATVDLATLAACDADTSGASGAAGALQSNTRSAARTPGFSPAHSAAHLAAHRADLSPGKNRTQTPIWERAAERLADRLAQHLLPRAAASAGDAGGASAQPNVIR